MCTDIEILPSTEAQRQQWFEGLTASVPPDMVGLLSDLLPSVLARRDKPALRVVARYLDDPDPLVRN